MTAPTDTETCWRSRSARRWLLVALLLGLCIRIPLLVHADQVGPVGDQLQYSAQAHANSDGRWYEQPFTPGAPAAEHPPLTSAVLTPISWVFHDSGLVLSQRLVVLAVGLVNIVLLFALGGRWSHTVAAVAAVLAAADVRLALSDVLVLSETFGVTLMTLLLLAATTRRVRRPVADAVAIGGLLGLLLLTRPELTLLVPIMCVWWWATTGRGWSARRLSTVALPALVAGLVVAPWVLWNQSRFVESVTLSTNDGFTLLGANCPDTYFGDNIGGYSIVCALSVEGQPGQDASQVSAARRQIATDYARAHVGRLPIVGAARFVRQWELGWVGRTASDSVDEGRPPWIVLVGSVQWWLGAGVAAVGLVRMQRARRWLLLLAPIVVTVAAVTVNAQWRLRAAAEPSVVIAAAVGLVAIVGARRGLGEVEVGVEPDR